MISVIVPALNEERALGLTLETLLHQDGVFETILVDGFSEDNTLSIARQYSDVRIIQAGPGRGIQMNAGAALASGEILLFLHADTLLPDGAIRHLNALEPDTGVRAGGFQQSFSSNKLPLRLVSWLHNFRCRCSGIFYGDQAMFVRRELFDTVGGFAEDPILEDVKFSEAVLRTDSPTLLEMTVTTDSRKFEQMGPWRSLWRCCLIILSYQLRLPIMGRAFFSPIR